MRVAVVSCRAWAPSARLSADSARTAMPGAVVHVLDLDGTYPADGADVVRRPEDVALEMAPVRRWAAAGEGARVLAAARSVLVRDLLATSETAVLDLRPGVVVLRAPRRLADEAARHGSAAPRPAVPAVDGLWPGADDLVADHPERGEEPPMVVWTRFGDRPAVLLDDGWLVLDPVGLRAEHRVSTTADGTVAVDGVPVTAVDLSNLDADHPWLLDARARREPRARLSDHPVLAELVADAARRLRRVAEDVAARPGTWDARTTALGTPVDPALRSLYAAPESASAPDPFDPGSTDALRAWLTAPEDGGLPRYLLAIRRSRADLAAAFPEVPGPDAEPFLAWVQRYSRREGFDSRLVSAVLPLAGVPADPPPPPPRRTRPALGRDVVPGVTVVGFLGQDLGIGESARQMVRALTAAGVPHASLPVTPPTDGVGPVAHPADATPPFDTALVCLNADVTPAVVDAVAGTLGPAYRVGMWYWEVEDFPVEQHGAFEDVDEVWVATDFVRRAIAPHSPVPVTVVPPPLPQRPAEPTLTRADLGLPDGFVFLFSFDYLSTAERKNPWGLVSAFTSAFAPGEGPTLVLKSINADRRPRDAERLRLATADRDDIVLVERRLDPAERDGLVALSDCYVSLHRSEGLGLTMAEAMAWGKPVVATAYGGNTAFMDDANSFLVPWRPATIPADAPPYPAGGTWADPDLDAAAQMLRRVVDDPADAAARGARAAADIERLHSPAVAGARVAERLAEIRRERGRPVVVVGAALKARARRVKRALRGPAS